MRHSDTPARSKPRSESDFHFVQPCNAGLTRLQPGSRPIFRTAGLPAWTLNRTVAGVGVFRQQGERFTTAPGDLVLIAPGAANDYGPTQQEKWDHQWSVFAPPAEWDPLLTWPEHFDGHFILRAPKKHLDRTVGQDFDRLIADSQGGHPKRGDLALVHVHLILTRIQSENPLAQQRPLDPRLVIVRNHIIDHIAEEIAIPHLAQLVAMSESRLSHLFKEQMGISPRVWIERRRIRLAGERLLMTNDPIAGIGRSVGFHDESYFSRVFKRLTGRTPRAWRSGR